MSHFETAHFFKMSSGLNAAERSADAAAAAEFLDELLMLWWHGADARVRARCAAILEARGMADAMASLIDQGAAV